MRTKTIARLAAGALTTLALAAPGAASAAPVIEIAASTTPATVPAGGFAKFELTAKNIGDEATTGDFTVDFTVPAGLKIWKVTPDALSFGGESFPLWSCTTAPDSQSASCTGPDVGFGHMPVEPGKEEACEDELVGGFIPISRCRIGITVQADDAASPGTAVPTIHVSGGGSVDFNGTAPIEVGPPAQFEAASFDGEVLEEDGDPATQAGSHPYTAATEFSVSTVLSPTDGIFYATEDFQDAAVELPPGLVGNPTAYPTCTQVQLRNKVCPPGSQVGKVRIKFGVEFLTAFKGVFNMERPRGVPALFAFSVANTLVQVYPRLRTGDDYGLTVLSKNAPQTIPIHRVSFTFWGTPSDPTHDGERLCAPWGPFSEEEGKQNLGCSGSELRPFISLPTSCQGPGPNNSVETSLALTSWQGSSDSASFFSHDNTEPEPNPIGNTGCNTVPFEPTLQARPTTNVADAASGLDVDVHIPQSEECDAGPPVSCETAEANLKDTTVILPQGMVVNPSGANGLGSCSEAQFGFTSKEGDTIHTTPGPASCPEQAKLGNVEVDTPLVDHPLKGSVYIAAPHANPFNSLLAIYITLDDRQTGIVAKLAGEVHADPNTGQLTTTVLHNPQLPFEDFKLHFFGGAGGSLRTPATCGTYSTTSNMVPWTAPEGQTKNPSDPWAIQTAPGGGTCPTSQGQLANSPDLDAGSTTPVAAASTPTIVNLRRNDGTQEFSKITLKLPSGLTGKLAGISQCSDDALASAGSKSGREEEASPSCPSSSRIGRVDVAAGAGPAPYNTTGTAYLTGPYKGAPVSMAIVTPATAGPFDLGTVVVRVALYLDPSTGQITAVSDELPRILQGIPLDIRSARVRLDRDNFTRNGTSCDPSSFDGSLVSTLNQIASLSERFQLGECSSLPFKPKLGIRLFGGTKRGSHPALRGTVTLPEGGANVAKASVALPHSEFLDQGHIGTVCTRVQFSEGDGNGSNCPAASIYGHAVATSPLVDYALQGNAYLRSSSNELPDLVIALHGPPSQPVAVDVVGRIDSVKGGIRTTFEGVPDLPVSSFVLNMEGGRKGLLQNSTNICKGVHKVTAEFDGQNGKAADLNPMLRNGKCGKQKPKAKRHARPAR